MVASVDTIGDVDVPLLAQRAQAGNMEAFDVLVQRYEGSIFRYLMRSLRNSEDASDYAQQVFLKAWLNLSSLHNMAQFNAWLFSIARNLMRDYWRAKKPSCLSWDELLVENKEPGGCDPEERAANRELMSQALDQLAPKVRDCLVLRVVWGYLPCEIAGMVGISVSSVGTYISLAHRQLTGICQRLMSAEQLV